MTIYQNRLQVLALDNQGIKFVNSRLELWFDLRADPERDGKDWYSGSATSVLLDGKETLDPFTAELPWLYMTHDREKRCMQVDQIQIMDINGQIPMGLPEPVYKCSYELISQSQETDKIIVTIASAPFKREYPENNSGKTIPTEFRLYRTLSLESNSDLMKERLFIRGTQKIDDNIKFITPYFSASYFSYVAFQDFPKVYWNEETPDVFSLGYSKGDGPYPGYGFASDVNISNYIDYPDPNFPNKRKNINSFSWHLAPCKCANCLHLFMRYEKDNFYSRILDCWKNIINPNKNDCSEEEIDNV